MNAPAQPAKDDAKLRSMSVKHADSARFEQLLAAEELNDLLGDDHNGAAGDADGDVMLWSTERVRKWLVQVGLEELYGKDSCTVCFAFSLLPTDADQHHLCVAWCVSQDCFKSIWWMDPCSCASTKPSREKASAWCTPCTAASS